MYEPLRTYEVRLYRMVPRIEKKLYYAMYVRTYECTRIPWRLRKRYGIDHEYHYHCAFTN